MTPSGATGTGGAASCKRFSAIADTVITHESKLLIVTDLAGPSAPPEQRFPDVVVASDTAMQTSVLYGNGTNKLDPGTPLSSGMIGAPSSITFGDVDANGLPDLVQLSVATGQVSYANNTGNQFADWKSLKLVPAGMPTSGAVASAQIDGTGPEDLVVALGLKLTTFLLDNTGGVMQHERPLPFEATALDVAKLDGDEVNDYVIMSTAMSQIAFISGTSDGSMMPPVYSVAANPVQSGLADFNEDGALDIVTSSVGSIQVSLLLNEGKGQFKTSSVDTGMSTGGLAVADFNGDGHQDLALSGDGTIEVLLGVGDGTFKSPVKFSGLPRSNVIRAADMNGDGRPDLVEGSDTAFKVRVFLNCK